MCRKKCSKSKGLPGLGLSNSTYPPPKKNVVFSGKDIGLPFSLLVGFEVGLLFCSANLTCTCKRSQYILGARTLFWCVNDSDKNPVSSPKLFLTIVFCCLKVSVAFHICTFVTHRPHLTLIPFVEYPRLAGYLFIFEPDPPKKPRLDFSTHCTSCPIYVSPANASQALGTFLTKGTNVRHKSGALLPPPLTTSRKADVLEFASTPFTVVLMQM